ncbi:J domain-containing protein [Clavibacter tessellarius]|uniref:J domain-containing protein n=1 Tax=Clavibacter tessellarius TaxID=31965 RepID=UPI003251E940
MTPAGSPADRTPYEVLGVDPAAGTAALRAAYRRLVRATHPDTGGEAHLFHAVQRAWELVGDPDDRARYDRGQGRASSDDDPLHPDEAGYAPAPGSGARLGATVHGTAGALARAHYLERVAAWQGTAPGGDLGVDPWAPETVRRAPRDVRWLLAKALAEEATARAAASLGMGATVFHDVRPLAGAGKVDHVVLAPAGLFALSSRTGASPCSWCAGSCSPSTRIRTAPSRPATRPSRGWSGRPGRSRPRWACASRPRWSSSPTTRSRSRGNAWSAGRTGARWWSGGPSSRSCCATASPRRGGSASRIPTPSGRCCASG